MAKDTVTRRRFLMQSCAGVGSAWLASHWREILAAQQHAHRATASDSPPQFEILTLELRD